ncbi:MAG: hypothetical protein RL226_1640 [Bacteroidota bacterium]|jgi:uncharacterized membrane protein YvbJ
MSGVSRKCLECGHWNDGGSSHCTQCSKLIDPVQLQQNRLEEKRLREQTPPSWLDQLIDRTKQSKNPFVIAAVALLRAAWFVYWVVITFIIWLVAATPG